MAGNVPHLWSSYYLGLEITYITIKLHVILNFNILRNPRRDDYLIYDISSDTLDSLFLLIICYNLDCTFTILFTLVRLKNFTDSSNTRRENLSDFIHQSDIKIHLLSLYWHWIRRNINVSWKRNEYISNQSVIEGLRKDCSGAIYFRRMHTGMSQFLINKQILLCTWWKDTERSTENFGPICKKSLPAIL